MPPTTEQSNFTWLAFAFLTVLSWGVYGVLLRTGAEGMHDPINGRFKAFLWVGIAYFLVAVLAPIGWLFLRGADWHMNPGGSAWSLIAGIAGAVGAFGVILAFSTKGVPSTAAVMSIVFAGAPIVNAIVTIFAYPPPGGFGAIKWQFLVGIVIAALGAGMVTFYAPPAPPPKKPGAANAPTSSPSASAPSSTSRPDTR